MAYYIHKPETTGIVAIYSDDADNMFGLEVLGYDEHGEILVMGDHSLTPCVELAAQLGYGFVALTHHPDEYGVTPYKR